MRKGSAPAADRCVEALERIGLSKMNGSIREELDCSICNELDRMRVRVLEGEWLDSETADRIAASSQGTATSICVVRLRNDH